MVEWINQADQSILQWIYQNLHNPFSDFIMKLFTNLGDWGFLWIIISVILLCKKKYRPFGVLLLLVLACNLIVGEIVIKNLIARARPFINREDIILLIQQPSGYSFPSSHASSSFAAAFVLTKANKKLVWFYLPSFLIAFSRIFLYVHHPSDILAGIFLGTLLAWLVYLPFNSLYLHAKKVHKTSIS